MSSQFGLVFFDVDSTLVTIEGIDALAGNRREIAALTEAAMNGSIPIDEVYARRLDLIRPSASQVEALGQGYLLSIVPGAEDVIATLLDAGVDVHLVTAGIEQAVQPLAAHLGLPEKSIHAVPLLFDRKGRYRGFDPGCLLTQPRGKETVVLDVRARSHGRAAFVGDGATDLDAREAVDLFIGYGGVRVRERVRYESDVFVEDLRAIPPLILEGHPTGVQQFRRKS